MLKMNHVRIALTVSMLAAVLVATSAQEALAYETGYVCKYRDPVDAWGIHNGDEDSRRTNYISGYLGCTIKIWVDPEWPLDVAVGLFVCVDYVGGTDCRPLKVVDNKWEGGKEYLRYYVDPDGFSFTEILSGYWIIGVFAVDGCDDYKIEVDVMCTPRQTDKDCIPCQTDRDCINLICPMVVGSDTPQCDEERGCCFCGPGF